MTDPRLSEEDLGILRKVAFDLVQSIGTLLQTLETLSSSLSTLGVVTEKLEREKERIDPNRN